MSQTTIQDILPLVQMPSRYLGNEINCVRKNWKETRLHVALAFPDLYEIATSHFGIQILYGMLNEKEDILAERVYAPAVDLEEQLRKNRIPLFSLESQTPLHQFDIIGFSLLYELNYTNMVNMIDLAKLPFFSDQRKENDPFLIAGGPCTCNPEPIAEFFDAIVIGDGEAVVYQLMDEWKKWSESDSRKRKDLLFRWSKIKGVYIPSFFETGKDMDQRLIPENNLYPKVERACISDLNNAYFPVKPIVPFGRPIHDRLRMEIARGCTRGCRFCQAGMIYRPVRERHPKSILDSVHCSLRETGYEDLSLLSLSTGDYSCIAELMKKIMAYGKKDHVAVSLPSLRAGSLTSELMELIRQVRKTGFTIAPEAGSQRLRDVINKNITEQDIIDTVTNAFALGWKIIKLYFMVGLPTENHDDVKAIVELVKRLKSEIKKSGQSGRINVSVATFVPKPHTPFQWEPQLDLESAMEKINWIKDQLKIPGVHVKWQDPKVSLIEGVWSRGDRKLNKVLLIAWERGCRFDGWTDFFNYDKWIDVFQESDIALEDYTRGYQDTEKRLPWDHVFMGVDRSFLVEEKDRAIKGEITGDCRTGSCSGCGVCDFKTLQPISFHDYKNNYDSDISKEAQEISENSFTYRINFKKMGESRLLGHLEMVKIFTRSLRREGIPLKYSRGFHPMPKISFADTLPMGMQSEDEAMLITVTEMLDADWLVSRLGRQLPKGMEITFCSLVHRKNEKKIEMKQAYRVELKDGIFLKKDLDWFFRQQNVMIERKSKKGKSVFIDLKEAVAEIYILDEDRVTITLGKNNNRMVRPAEVMKKIFHLTDQQILTAITTKTKADYV